MIKPEIEYLQQILIFKIRKIIEQAGAELGQAQLKLGLDFSFIFFRNDLSRFVLVELVQWIMLDRPHFVNSVLLLWFGIFGSINLVWYF